MAAIFSRRLFRIGIWVVLVLLALPLAVFGAWILSNRLDIDPVSPPSALTVPEPTVADENNAFFTLLGLLAAEDADPAAAGKARWDWELARSDELHARLVSPAEGVVSVGGQLPEGTAIPATSLRRLIGEKPISCPDFDACVEFWLANVQTLSDLRGQAAVLGQRCDALLTRDDFAFEERLPPMRGHAETFAPHALGALDCSKWLLSSAVLAWRDGRTGEAVGAIHRATRLSRGLLDGSHSLIGRMNASSVASQTLMVFGALAVRDADIARAVKPLLDTPWVDPPTAIQGWVAIEASFARGVFAEMARQSELPAQEIVSNPPQTWLQRVGWRAFYWVSSLGFQPQRAIAASDARWMRFLADLPADLPALMAHARDKLEPPPSAFAWRDLVWHNTFGQMMVAAGSPGYVGLLARDFDLLLRQQTVSLAVDASLADPTEAQRSEWTSTRQNLPDDLRARLHWLDDGKVLAVDTWASTYSLRHGPAEGAQVRIRFPESSVAR